MSGPLVGCTNRHRAARWLAGRPSVKFETAPAFRRFTSRNTRISHNAWDWETAIVVCGQRLSTGGERCVFVFPRRLKRRQALICVRKSDESRRRGTIVSFLPSPTVLLFLGKVTSL